MSMEVGDEIHITRNPNYGPYVSYLLIVHFDVQVTNFYEYYLEEIILNILKGLKFLLIVFDASISIKIKIVQIPLFNLSIYTSGTL